jgi:hypothetical protein
MMLYLYLADSHAVLYDKTWSEQWRGPLTKAYAYLRDEDLLNQNIRILVDRSLQDIQVEVIPPLFLWDYYRIFRHKHRELISRGGLFALKLFKDVNDLILVWVHISLSDPLFPILHLAKGRVYFIPLEIGSYPLEKVQSPYLGLLYPLIEGQQRLVIFKNKRILLSRVVQSKDEINTAVHYLSRTNPDILELFHVKQFDSILLVLQFIGHQKKPLLRLRQRKPLPLIKLSIGFLGLSCLMYMSYGVYQVFEYKEQSSILKVRIQELKDQSEKQKKVDNGDGLRLALETYQFVSSRGVNPLETIEVLSQICHEAHIRLVRFDWNKDQEINLYLTFLKEDTVTDQFDPMIHSLRIAFPHHQVQVVEAPYNWAVHETFKGIDPTSPPQAHIRMQSHEKE